MVPGGRFNEFYYWDNLWIVNSLNIIFKFFINIVKIGKKSIFPLFFFNYLIIIFIITVLNTLKIESVFQKLHQFFEKN